MPEQHDESEFRGATAAHKAIGGGWGFLLSAGGLALVAAGLVLVLLPRFAPEYAWSVAKLGRNGLTGGPLIFCGALVVGFGWLSRGQARLSRQLVDQPDGQLFLEHVAQELASLRVEFGELHARIDALRDGTQGLIEAVEARESLSGTDADARDSIFRLAASLDRLGARLEQGQLARHDETRSSLEALGQRLDELAQVAASAPVQVAGTSPVLRPEPPDDETDGPQLGLLDHLDDQGQFRQTAGAGGELRLSQSGASDGEGTQLEELRSLLSDERVRQALDSLRLG